MEKEGGCNNEGKENQEETRSRNLYEDGKPPAQGERRVYDEQRGDETVTRYIIRKQEMPMQIILKPDGAKLLTIKKVLKETGCYIYDIEEVELQRTFPIDAKELYDWYNRSARESNMAKHRERPWTGWAAGQIWAAHEAAKIGEEITSVKFWIAEHKRGEYL